MHYNFVDLVTFNLFVLDKEVVNHCDLLEVNCDTPNINLAVTVSNKQSSIVVEYHRVRMLLFHQALIPFWCLFLFRWLSSSFL